ncbi:Por secretion system C-terminal sorting domain-containing protein [Flexibacter flexilis DSM 6793]|uniref:Por secretion system C-terminal sorting domain-containing protein n=1 Tax=Flexibacter flexilis DSM 6793 TaxID=927664 RepID=A0A1I1MK49_9BACT|nr:T9SS type A sorting domain-containing protein [Flexibacter flexilis]SFC83013.1 Por secretion system C-terminal sorting domain-containing protein [Flexibacter flexilis DSM 6793]
MSNFNKIKTLACAAFVTLSSSVFAQTTTKQIIIANGGKYEYMPPFEDYLTLTSYNPANGQSNTFATIQTQSVQDVEINNGELFVAAQDSIVRYNLDNYQVTGKAAFSPVRKLRVAGDRLLVGKYYGGGAFFFIYDKATLQPLDTISQITNEVRDIAVVGDTAYVAHNLVSSAYADSVGYIGVVKISTGEFIQNIDLGAHGAGLSRLFVYGKKVIGIAGKSHFLHQYSTANGSLTSDSIGVLSGGTALVGNTLYANFSRGIGSYNIANQTITDTVIVDTLEIVASTFDVNGSRFYVTQTDFFSFVTGGVYNLTGAKVATLPVGKSPEAIGIDYRTSVSVRNNLKNKNLTVYPNPSSKAIWIDGQVDFEGLQVSISDMTGRVLRTETVAANTPVSIEQLPQGMYIMEIEHNNTIFRTKFIKQ